MNFQSMDYFIMVAKKRNISKAAETLHITQQTLSGHIAALEKDLGCKLFVRHVPLELTYGGKVFLQYAVSFQKKYLALRHEFSDIAHNQKGKLRVGIGYARSRSFMPGIIIQFQQLHPQVEVEVIEDTNVALQKKLLNGELDIAIANFPDKIAGIRLLDFYEEEIVLFLADTLLQRIYGSQAENVLQRLNKHQELALLEPCPFLLNIEGNAVGRIARSIIEKADFQPTVVAQSGSVEMLLMLCVKGVGACFCPKNMAKLALTARQLSQLHLIHLKESVHYMTRFGIAEQSYQWKVINDFLSSALQQHGA